MYRSVISGHGDFLGNLALKFLLGFLLLPCAQAKAALSCPRNVWLFYPYWSAYNASNIPYSKVTHLAHAFVDPNSDGSLSVPAGYLEPALIANANAAGVTVVVSVGGAGGTNDVNYRAIASSAAARTAFAVNLEAFIRSNGYSGVDIDWEFPANSTDRANLNLMIQEIRNKFNSSAAPSPGWIITADVSMDQYYGQWWDVATLKNLLDYFNIMVYDMHGDWSGWAGPNSALDDPVSAPAAASAFNGVRAMSYWLGTRATPPGKVQYGLPFYGYQYPAMENIYDICASPCTANYISYPNIAALIGAGWTRTYEALSEEPYLRKDVGAGFISYDDAQSIAVKTTWALWTKNLAGVFAWEITQDYVGPGNQPLLDAMWNAAQCPPPTATPTATLTPSPSVTDSPSFSATETDVPPGSSLTDTPSSTPTPVFSATPSPAIPATITAPVNGPLRIKRVLPVPNPNPVAISVELEGPADELSVRVYSSALALAMEIKGGAGVAGKNLVPLPPETMASLAAGSWYFEVIAKRALQQTKGKPGTFYLIR